MNKTDGNKENSQSLKPKAPFLQAVQEAHEVIAAAERALFVSRDAVKRCDPRLLIQPDCVGIGIPAWCFIHIQHIPSLRLLSQPTVVSSTHKNGASCSQVLFQAEELFAEHGGMGTPAERPPIPKLYP